MPDMTSRSLTAGALAGFLLGMMPPDLAGAQSPPLPPPRPAEPAGPVPLPPAAPQPPTAPADVATPTTDGTCLTRLRDAGFTVFAAAPPPAANGSCTIEDAVRLTAVPVPGRVGAGVALPGQPLLACRFAEIYGRWLGELVAPVVAARLGSELRAVQTGPGFECRNVNRSASGKLSAHAEGLAIDTAALDLADGTRLSVKPGGPAAGQAVLDTVRQAGCGWFTTILGPGSDAAHGDHLHVDVQRHGSSDRYRICQ